MSDAHGVSRDQLRAFIERIERLEEEKKTIADDIKDVYGEAKSMGFDTKILRKVISIRKIDADVRAEQEAILDTYLGALGMIQTDMFDDEPRQKAPVDREARAKRRTSEAMDDNKAFSAELVSAGLISEEAHAENVAISNAVARKFGAGVIDTETGEFLNDEQPETANEPSAASGGEPSIPSSDDGGAKMDGRANDDPGRSAEQAVGHYTQSEQATNSADGKTPAPSFLVKPPSPLRPHCQRPQMCAGVGRTHCYTCAKAMREQEEMA